MHYNDALVKMKETSMQDENIMRGSKGNKGVALGAGRGGSRRDKDEYGR